MTTPQDPFAPPPRDGDPSGAGQPGPGDARPEQPDGAPPAWGSPPHGGQTGAGYGDQADGGHGSPAGGAYGDQAGGGYGSQPGGGYAGQPGGFGGQGGGSGQPGYGAPPPYGSQPYGSPYGAPAQRRNGMGVAALVLGLLALVTSFTVVGGVVLGIVAIILGIIGRGRAKRGEADNGGVALAGIVLGVVGVALAALFVVIGVAIFNSDSGRDLIDCVEDAGDDQSAVEDCERQFADDLGG